MQIIVDYLVLTRKNQNIDFFKNLLPVNTVNWQLIKSFYGYDTCIYYEGVKIHYGGRDDICLDISGKGCRTIEALSDMKFDWLYFFFVLKNDIEREYIHISRLDIACDIFDNEFKYNKLVQHIRQEKYICKSNSIFWTDGIEQAIYYGSPKSDRRLRIYNKAMEQGFPKEIFWFRLEFQFRNDSALSFLLNLYEQQHIGKTYLGILKGYLRYTEKVVDKENKNYNKVKTVKWWEDFLCGVDKLKNIYLEGNEYNYISLENYLRVNCGSSIVTYLLAHGGNINSLIELVKDVNINKKQELLLKELLK